MPLKGYVLQVMISVEVLWLCWQFLVLTAFAIHNATMKSKRCHRYVIGEPE